METHSPWHTVSDQTGTKCVTNCPETQADVSEEELLCLSSLCLTMTGCSRPLSVSCWKFYLFH